ncbi:CSMD2 [Branchiostoma lanceolatum]|uniref:CSMD2 protein n=1 Tax=Branchiostoma lanceolatum TaxID=7740 RepID=A0A8J9VCX3_BRALA|nr:CSMD2 [Branchiostoma lanceolatum]
MRMRGVQFLAGILCAAVFLAAGQTPVTPPAESHTDCGGNFTGSSGELLSPQWPQDYDNNASCVYHIAAQPRYFLTLSVNAFSTADAEDVLTIYNGMSAGPPDTIIGSYSGHMLGAGDVINSTGNQLYLTFTSDAVNGTGGFNITYRAQPVPAVACPDPGSPDYGSRVGGDFRPGSTVQFSCDDGYTLYGNASLTCTDGSWDARLPTCKAECGGNITNATSGVILSPGYPDRYTANLSCTWSLSAPEGTLLQLMFNNFSLEDGKDFLYANDENRPDDQPETTLTGSTVPANWLSWTNNVVLQLVTGADAGMGGFSLAYESIPKTFCRDPGPILHGVSTSAEVLYSAGQSVSYSCDAGYQLLGNTTLTCLQGRQRIWDAAPPVCYAPCGGNLTSAYGTIVSPTHDPDNAVSRDCYWQVHVDDSSSVIIMFNSFQLRESDAYLTIFDGGDIAAAPLANFSSTAASADVYSTDSQVLFLFHHGATDSYGNFSLTYFAQKKHCPDPGTVNNSQRSGDDFSVRSSVNYTCDKGYDLEGQGTIVCKPGNPPTWDYPKPRCVLVKECDDPGTPENGQRDSDDFSVGASVSYSCPQGYQLTGETTLTCRRSPGSRPKWDYQRPVCEEVPIQLCHDPAFLHYGTYTPRTHHYFVGSVVTFSCDSGYMLKGNTTLVCIMGDSRLAKPRWSNAYPTCEKAQVKTSSASSGGNAALGVSLFVVLALLGVGGVVAYKWRHKILELLQKTKTNNTPPSFDNPMYEVPANNPDDGPSVEQSAEA